MLVRTLALAALLIAAPAAAAPAKPAGALRLIDLTPAFATSWEATRAMPDHQRPVAFRASFAPVLPGFYEAARTGADPARYNARVLRGLNAYPEQRAGIAAVSARFDTMFQPALQSFERRFGPMRGYPPIYLVNSLGEFDGGTREIEGRPVLLFGADVIARLHMTHDIQPFFHHELFHLYHQRRFAECDQVWCSLWAEGLAVYVAKALNPQATDEDLLLTVPEPLRAAVEKDRSAAVCAVRAWLDSKDEKVKGALFSSNRWSPALPPRFGYYVGYLAAEEMGRTRSLAALAALKPDQVRPELEATLKRLGDGCSGLVYPRLAARAW